MNKLWMIFVLITEWNVMDRIQSEIIPGTFFLYMMDFYLNM